MAALLHALKQKIADTWLFKRKQPEEWTPLEGDWEDVNAFTDRLRGGTRCTTVRLRELGA